MGNLVNEFEELLHIARDGIASSLFLATFQNGDEIAASGKCWCLECNEVFDVNQIDCWVDGDETALCPDCGRDNVVPGYSAPNSPALRSTLAADYRERLRNSAGWMRSDRLHVMIVYFPYGERGCSKRYAHVVFKGLLQKGLHVYEAPKGIGRVESELVVSYEPSRSIPVRYGFTGFPLYPVEVQEGFLNVAADDLDDRGASWGLVLSTSSISSDKHLSFLDVVDCDEGKCFEEMHVFNECHQHIFDMEDKSLDEALAMSDDEKGEFIIEHVLPWLKRDGGELEWEAEDVIDMLRSWTPGQYEGTFEPRY